MLNTWMSFAFPIIGLPCGILFFLIAVFLRFLMCHTKKIRFWDLDEIPVIPYILLLFMINVILSVLTPAFILLLPILIPLALISTGLWYLSKRVAKLLDNIEVRKRNEV